MRLGVIYCKYSMAMLQALINPATLGQHTAAEAQCLCGLVERV